MGLFSEELLELDRNTVKYMIDEMQEEIDASKRVIEEKDQQLQQQAAEREAEQNLYKKLEREGRHEELMRAIRDEVFRRELLEEEN